MRMSFLVSALIALLLCQVDAIPTKINYQGKATDEYGVALDGNYAIQFRIYNSATGGFPLWTESHPSVPIVKGLFDVVLGSLTPINLPFDVPYWMEIEIAGETLTPRVPLTSVGYAFRAAIADSSGDVAWINISGIPAGFADGIDDVGTGDITAVSAGQGLTGGGTSGDVTIDVGAGTGIAVSADVVSFDAAWGDARYINEGQSAGGDLSGTYPNPEVIDDSHSHSGTTITDGTITNADISDSYVLVSVEDGAGVNQFNITDGDNSLEIAAGTGTSITFTPATHRITISATGTGGDITAVSAGQGLTGGGTSGDVTLDLGDGTGYSPYADNFTINLKSNGGLSFSGDSIIAADPSPTNEIQTASWAGSGTQYLLDLSNTNDELALRAGSGIGFIQIGDTLRIDNTGGDITAVYAGTGLTGGGTSGDVTLSLSTPVSIANGGTNATSFTGSQFIWYDGTSLAASGYGPSSFALATNAFVQNGNSFGGLATLGTNDAYDLAFETNNTEKMRILTNGNVGINTTTPNAKLEVNSGTSGMSGLRFTQLTSASSAAPAGTKVLSVDASGNVVLVTDAGSPGTVTLQTAYDGSGSGAGRTINTFSGNDYPVTINGGYAVPDLGSGTALQVNYNYDTFVSSGYNLYGVRSNLQTRTQGKGGAFAFAGNVGFNNVCGQSGTISGEVASGYAYCYSVSLYGTRGSVSGATLSNWDGSAISRAIGGYGIVSGTTTIYNVGTNWVAGLYGEVGGSVNITPSSGAVAGVVGISSETGEATSYGGYFSGGDYAGYFVGNVYASGNVGIGTSPGVKLDVNGNIRTNGQLISTVATGTAPLVVSSTTLVTNLNADMVDGQHYSSNWNLWTDAGDYIYPNSATNFTIYDNTSSWVGLCYVSNTNTWAVTNWWHGPVNTMDCYSNDDVTYYGYYTTGGTYGIYAQGSSYAGYFVGTIQSTGLGRFDGGVSVDGNMVIDDGAGWHRSYGNTGWYNGTYGGGIWMQNANYVEVYGGKGFLVPSNNVGIYTTSASSKLSINSAGSTNYQAYVYRGSGDYGADRAGIYSYRYGGSNATDGGTSWSVGNVDAAIKGASYWGNRYTAGIAAYNYLDYDTSAALVAANWWGGPPRVLLATKLFDTDGVSRQFAMQMSGNFYNQEAAYAQQTWMYSCAWNTIRSVTITTHGTGPDGSVVIINASASGNLSSPGWFSLGIFRDGVELCEDSHNWDGDGSNSIVWTDEPTPGTHTYELRYCSYYSVSSWYLQALQVVEIKR